jgi:trimethylguanosine synthase
MSIGFVLVIAIDYDPRKIKLAMNNAKVYGVAERINFMTGDYFRHKKDLQADVVFMSPPWGSPAYTNCQTFHLADMCTSQGGGQRILEIAKEIAPKIAVHLPRNIDKKEVRYI